MCVCVCVCVCVLQLVTGANLVSVLDALDYRESKTLFIHATLVSISFACSAPALTTHATSDGQGRCVAGLVCGRVGVWQGRCVVGVWQGRCVVGYFLV